MLDDGGTKKEGGQRGQSRGRCLLKYAKSASNEFGIPTTLRRKVSNLETNLTELQPLSLDQTSNIYKWSNTNSEQWNLLTHYFLRGRRETTEQRSGTSTVSAQETDKN